MKGRLRASGFRLQARQVVRAVGLMVKPGVAGDDVATARNDSVA